MKILLLINSLGAGGAERSTLELAKYLIQSQHDVRIICLKHKKFGLEEEAAAAGVPLTVLKSGTFRSKYQQLKAVVTSFHPDIVHSVLFEANILLRTLKFFDRSLRTVESLVNTPYTKERQADSKLPKAKFALVKLYDALTARLSRSHYHTITRKVYEHYHGLYGIQPGQYSVIYRGRRTNDKLAEREAIRRDLLLDKRFVLINVGRQEFQKGQLVLLKAISRLKNAGHDISMLQVIVLGREGEYTPGLLEFVKSDQLESVVTFAGFRNDVDRYLAAADVFVFPSYFEGLGGALIEGLAAHLPVICSDLPVLREVMGDDNAALFFETGNDEALAAALLKIHSDSALRTKLAEASFRRYSDCFDLDSIHRQMLNMYNHILHGNTTA